MEGGPGCLGMARRQEGTVRVLAEEVGSSRKTKKLMGHLKDLQFNHSCSGKTEGFTEWEKHT